MLMTGHKRLIISIWFFIGVLLTIYGILILGSGVYELFVPPTHVVVLAKLHSAVWWGALMIVLGLFYSIRFRPGKE